MFSLFQVCSISQGFSYGPIKEILLLNTLIRGRLTRGRELIYSVLPLVVKVADRLCDYLEESLFLHLWLVYIFKGENQSSIGNKKLFLFDNKANLTEPGY